MPDLMLKKGKNMLINDRVNILSIKFQEACKKKHIEGTIKLYSILIIFKGAHWICFI